MSVESHNASIEARKKYAMEHTSNQAKAVAARRAADAEAPAAPALKKEGEKRSDEVGGGRHEGGFVGFVSPPPGHFLPKRNLPPLLSAVDKLPIELVPLPLQPWVAYHAQQLQAPLEFVAVPALVAAAGCIGRQVGVRLRRHAGYVELPILWGAAIGRPSTGKSPAMKPVVRILKSIEDGMREVWQRESGARAREAEFKHLAVKIARDKAGKMIAKGDKDGARAALDAEGEAIEEVPEPRLVVNDCTVEKLAVLLSQSPNGLIQVRDELTGWLSSLERDGANDRPFYLEAWNGFTPYSVDRITRQSIRVERPCLSIMGSIQPGRLEDYVRQAVRGGSGDDGLLQRFQLAVYPDFDSDWTLQDAPIDPLVEHSALVIYQRLRTLDLAEIDARTTDWSEVPFVELDDAAMNLFVGYVEPLMKRLRQGTEAPAMESHLGKYQSLVGRLALVLHLIEGRRGMIAADTMLIAISWAEFLEPHARRMYGIAVNAGLAGAHRMLARLESLSENGFTSRDVVRRGWGGLDQSNVPEACEILVDHGYLSRTDSETDVGGRPTVIYRRVP